VNGPTVIKNELPARTEVTKQELTAHFFPIVVERFLRFDLSGGLAGFLGVLQLDVCAERFIDHFVGFLLRVLLIGHGLFVSPLISRFELAGCNFRNLTVPLCPPLSWAIDGGSTRSAGRVQPSRVVTRHPAVEFWLFPERNNYRKPTAIGSNKAPSCGPSASSSALNSSNDETMVSQHSLALGFALSDSRLAACLQLCRRRAAC